MSSAPRPALPYPPALMGETSAAAYLGVSASTLRTMADAGEAPAPVYVRTRRLYRRADLDAWVASLPSVGETVESEAAARCDAVFGVK